VSQEHAATFKIISKHRMISHYFPKLKICIDHLSHESIWYKETDDLNNIGGIVVHLMEHLKRNTERLKDPNIQFAAGIESYFPSLDQDKSILKEQLELRFREFGRAMDQTAPNQIDIYSIYHLVEHTGYHVGQIIDRAQRMTGIRFQFMQNGINEKALQKLIQEELVQL
jgi:hypothetical protein